MASVAPDFRTLRSGIWRTFDPDVFVAGVIDVLSFYARLDVEPIAKVARLLPARHLPSWII
jgi:hypothetical protein